jgi:hypothetical protein
MATIHDLDYEIILWVDDAKVAQFQSNWLVGDVKSVVKYFMGKSFNWRDKKGSLVYYTRLDVICKGQIVLTKDLT